MQAQIRYFLTAMCLLLVVSSCGKIDPLEHLRNPENGKFENGKYCSRVTIIGTVPGSYRVYKLNVSVFDNHVTRIYWNNEAISNEIKGKGAKLSVYGRCKFKAENGQKITIQIQNRACDKTDRVDENIYAFYSFGDEFWTTCETTCEGKCEEPECESCEACDSCDSCDSCESCEDDPCDSY